jgi:peroxiredoxin
MAQRLPAQHRIARFLRAFARVLLISSLATVASASPDALIGQPAPDFALRTFSGENLRLSENLGDVVIVNFWATWCGPCRQEMPLLDEIQAKYHRAGMVLLSVNLDDDQQRAAEFARTLKISYPVLIDEHKDVARAFQVGTMPATVLIDRSGVIRYVSDGYKSGYEKRYTEKLRELLNE